MPPPTPHPQRRSWLSSTPQPAAPAPCPPGAPFAPQHSRRTAPQRTMQQPLQPPPKEPSCSIQSGQPQGRISLPPWGPLQRHTHHSPHQRIRGISKRIHWLATHRCRNCSTLQGMHPASHRCSRQGSRQGSGARRRALLLHTRSNTHLWLNSDCHRCSRARSPPNPSGQGHRRGLCP